jgi:hypothetical protein
MTATTEDVITDAGFDFSELSDDAVTADAPGPLHGSRGTATGRPRGRPRGRTPVKRLDTLQKRLSSEMFQAGTMVGFGLPVTGYYVCQESDSFTRAVVQLASHRMEWVEALEHLADIQPGIVVGRTAFGIGAAIAVDRDRVDPEKNKFLQFLGVTAAWKAVKNPDQVVEEGSAYKPPPAKFQPV